MEETIIRAIILGTMLGIVGLTVNLIWRFVRAHPEAARRVKVLAFWGFIAGYAGMVVSSPSGDRVFFIGLAMIVGVVYWVRKGMK